MKNTLHYLLLAIFCVAGGQVHAGSCGTGKVIEIVEGGWNNNDLLIRLDYSDPRSVIEHQQNFHGFIRFIDDLPAGRLEAIRKLALTALVSGKTVAAYTHNDSCSSATQLTLFAFR